MSGRKITHISVPADELRRLRREAAEASRLSRADDALSHLSGKTDQLLREQKIRLDSLHKSIQSMSRELERREAAGSEERRQLRRQLSETIAKTDRELQNMAEQNARQLNEIQAGFTSSLRQAREDTAHTITQSSRRLEQAICSAVSCLEKQIGSVSDRMDQAERSLDAIEQSDAALLEMAREYLETACLLMEHSEKNFRLELLLPGRAEAVHKAIKKAENDIATSEQRPTNSPIARHTARTAAEEAMGLREDIIRAEQEWQLRYQQARQTLLTAQAQREASGRIQLPDGDQSVPVDVDFWTDGALTALGERVDVLMNRLDDAELALSDLDGIQSAGTQIIGEIKETTEFAVIAIHASADRHEIAEDVAARLMEALNLTVEADGYQGDDQRAAHQVRLVNHSTGFDMVITQTPQPDENSVLINRLETDILDYGTNSMEQGDKIALQALESLRELGLCLGDVSTVEDFADKPSDRRQCADIPAWKREKEQAQKPRPIHRAGENDKNRSAETEV